MVCDLNAMLVLKMYTHKQSCTMGMLLVKTKINDSAMTLSMNFNHPLYKMQFTCYEDFLLNKLLITV